MRKKHLSKPYKMQLKGSERVLKGFRRVIKAENRAYRMARMRASRSLGLPSMP